MQHVLLHVVFNSKVKIIPADGKFISALPVYFRRIIFYNSDVGLNVNSDKVENSDSRKLCMPAFLTNSEDPLSMALIRDHFQFCFLNSE